jgi:hypothetical protein
MHCVGSLYGEGIAFYMVAEIIRHLVFDRTIHNLPCYLFQLLNKPIVREYSDVQCRYSEYLGYLFSWPLWARDSAEG